MFKETMIFVVGAAVGGFVSWYYVGAKERARSDEEIASMKVHYQEREKALIEKSEAAERRAEAAEKAKNSYEEACINLGASLKDAKKNSGTVVKEPEGENSRESIFRETSEDGDDDEEDEIGDGDDDEWPDEEDYLEDDVPIEGENIFTHDTRKADPYPIYEEQYSEEMCEFFDKMTLEYYLKDDMLLTEDGELVDDADKIVGDFWKDELLDGGEGAEAYVRNELVGADYLIVAKNDYGIDNIRSDFDDI